MYANKTERGRQSYLFLFCLTGDEKESTAYLMEWFTRELARRFSDELALTVKNGIADVQDSQIDSLDMMDGQKRVFRRIRDNLVRERR